MLFKRRTSASWVERIRVGFWPRVSWQRSAKYYIKRVLRLSATPYAIAIGCAVGASVSMTPFIGAHFIITFIITWLLRGNLLAGAIGTAVGNPITFPFIFATTHYIGSIVLGGGEENLPQDINMMEWAWENVKPLTIGAIPMALLVGLIVYAIVYGAVSAYQEARKSRIAERNAVGNEKKDPSELTDRAA